MTNRRPYVFAGLLALPLCVVLLFTAPLVHGEDWPRFLGPRGDGTSNETGLLEKWPDGGLPVTWQKDVGAGYSAPSVLGDKTILFHRVGPEEVVECLSSADGKSIWKYGYPSGYTDPYGYNNGPRCTPTIAGDFVYTYGAEGVLSCIRLANGESIWQSKTTERWNIPNAFFGVGSTPLLVDGKLYVMIGGQPESGLICMSAEDGTVIWESIGKSTWDGKPKIGWRGEPLVKWTGFEKMASYSSPTLATVHGKKVIFALMRQGLVMIEAESGEVLDSYWFRANVNESVNAINPIVVGNEVFLSAAYYKTGSVLLTITDKFKLTPKWKNLALEAHWSTPVVHNGYLYSFSGRNEPDSRFRCIEWRTGKVMWDRDESWRRITRTPETFGRGSAIIADGRLVTLGEGGILGLVDLNPDSLNEISRWQIPGIEYPCWATPVLANKLLYLRSENKLVCLNIGKQEQPPE